MEPKVVLANNGQQLTLDDVNALGDASALADDRVLAELLRMAPFNGTTVSRGIIPAGLTGFGQQVYQGANTGGVYVRPFRAVIGSRVTAATNPKANWRDIRSAISIGTTGTSGLDTFLSLAANASGNPRWDLVYAAVSVDGNANTVTRKIKNPTTKVIAGQSVTTQIATTVTLGVVTGTPAASAVWPSAPADAGGTYYIPLCYVLIQNGYNASATLVSGRFFPVANYLGTAPIEGSSLSLGTINQVRNLSTAQQQAAAAGPLTYGRNNAPPILSGTESVLLFLDLTTASPNVTSGQIVDNSRDWSYRYFRWTATGASAYSGSNGFPHNTFSSLSFISSNGGFINLQSSGSGNPSNMAVGMGSSFSSSPNANIMFLTNPVNTSGGSISAMSSSGSVSLAVDASGNLVCNYTNSPNCQLLIWLDATSQVRL